MAPHKFNGASRTPRRCYGEQMEHLQDETTYGYLREQRLEYQRHIYIYITVLDQTFYAHDVWPCKSPWFSDTAPSTGSKFLGDLPGKSARG